MYVNICGVPVNEKNFIGVFDMDTSTVSKKTVETLNRAQRESRLENRSPDIPRSFVFITEKESDRIILSGVSTRYLRVRSK